MHVLKNWKLSEPLENINEVIEKARKRKMLNEHENKYMKFYQNDPPNESSKSRKLMDMVSCYGDRLKTFLDILNETGNEQLARRISEKKSEFVFMIREKESLDVAGGRNHRSLLPSSLPTQFIYESTVKDVIDKIEEKYECRKPIADIFYIVIVCKNLSEEFIDRYKKDEISRFLINIYNIFGESKEIKIIVNVDKNQKEKENVNEYILPFLMMRNMEMYIFKTENDEEVKDLQCCVNVLDTLKKASGSKMKFFENYMYIILKPNTGKTIVEVFETLTEGIKISSKLTNNAEKGEEWVEIEIQKERDKIRDVEVMSKIKRIIIFFADEFWKDGKVSEHINTLFEKFSKFERRIDIVIQNSKKENELKVFEWKKKPNVTMYETDRNQWIEAPQCSNKNKISADDFLSEYCSKIE